MASKHDEHNDAGSIDSDEAQLVNAAMRQSAGTRSSLSRNFP
jgi:hypothetical protein